MDALDRAIVNRLQGDFPLSDRPFFAAAKIFGISEQELIDRVRALVDRGVLSRFGPMYNAERLGGAVTLAAMAVPADRFESVAALINAHAEVAHNYAREHALNMWFVIATERPDDIARVIQGIAAETGLAVFYMPKLDEYFIGLRLEA